MPMESEPQKEVRKRIAESPSKNDVDFFVRKVRRLESQNDALQDEVNKLRVRLRRAQDFQIKHEILLTELAGIKQDSQSKDKALFEVRSENEKLKASLHSNSSRDTQFEAERKRLQEDIQKWITKAEESDLKRVRDCEEERKSCQAAIKRQGDSLKYQFQEKREDYEFQLRQLRKVVIQKESMEGVIGLRVEKIRKEKDEQIARLSSIIEESKHRHKQTIDQKNDQIYKLKGKFQNMINFQLQAIRVNLDDQEKDFGVQFSNLREMLGLKHNENEALIRDLKNAGDGHLAERENLSRQIALLKAKIYQIEKQSELEMDNLKERMTKLHSMDLREMEKRYEDILGNLRGEKKQMSQYIIEMNNAKELDRASQERAIGDLNDRLKEKDQRINELLERLQFHGSTNTQELKSLHQSFQKIEAEKEVSAADYAQNVAFMTTQIAKLMSTNEVKNVEIKKIMDQYRDMKQDYTERIKVLQAKIRADKQEREVEKQKEKQQREQSLQLMATKELEWKQIQKKLNREREKEERQKNKMKFIVEELENDVARLNTYNKQLDENLRIEYKKNHESVIDGDGTRRQLTGELNRQKIELEMMKNMQVEQIRRKYEADNTRLTNQNERLKMDLLNSNISLEGLEAEYRKLDNANRNKERLSKEKLMDYEKKMATLSNEINLTQNLYQAFMDAKSKISDHP